jgi:phosphatidylserine/phosphatidylglycerophosphate/cardiolipin synthase-like enzyme
MAAKAGANEDVILPLEEQSDDATDANQLAKDGAHIFYDQAATTPPLHAKLAIVDGSAFLDGRNWDTTDIVISDTNPSDFTAITNALNLDPTSSTNLDTLKSLALQREANYLTAAAPASGATVRFMTESFSASAQNVISALETAAQNGATVEVVVLSSYVTGNSGEMSLLTTLKSAPYNMSVRLNPASGSEKIMLASTSPSTGWFGSTNATDASYNDDNYIDWGLTVTDPNELSALQTYFDTVYGESTPY